MNLINLFEQKRISKGFWIWGEFSYEDTKYLNKIKEKVNSVLKSPKFSIHLTLSGAYKEINKSFLEELRFLSKNNYELKLKLKGFEFKENVFESFYISLVYQDNLKDLRKKFSKLNKLTLDGKYNPHLSLAYGNHNLSDKIDLISILPELKSSILMTNISIVEVNEEINLWKVLERFKLKSN